MNTSNAESISTNVYNFTMNNGTAVEVQYGDELVQYGDELVIIPAPANPIYFQQYNGPQNYEINCERPELKLAKLCLRIIFKTTNKRPTTK